MLSMTRERSPGGEARLGYPTHGSFPAPYLRTSGSTAPEEGSAKGSRPPHILRLTGRIDWGKKILRTTPDTPRRKTITPLRVEK